MEGADALTPGKANKRVVRMEDGALLNRYWDDNDTPRPESRLDDVTTAKKTILTARPPKSIATYVPPRLPDGTSALAGWIIRSNWGLSAPPASFPVDLNALMFHMEKTIARASKAAGDSAKAGQYDALANARQKALEKNICGTIKKAGMPITI